MHKSIIILICLLLLIGSLSCSAVAASPEEEIIQRLIRLEEGQKSLNQRFDDVNRRFDDVNQKFNDVNQRFNDVNQRFNDINRRFDDLKGLLYVILAGMFALVGFVIWDRRTALAPAIKRTTILEDALKEYA